MHRTSKRVAVAAASLLTLVTVAACGQGSNGSSADSSATSSTSATVSTPSGTSTAAGSADATGSSSGTSSDSVSSTSGPASESTAVSVPTVAPAALSMWVMGDSSDAMDKILAPFTAKTGITVKVQAIPWDNVAEKLTTAVASGNGPDVSQIGLSDLPSYLAAGALKDVSAEVGQYPNLADSQFPAAVSQKALSPNGGVFSLPWISDTRVLFYRSDLLSAAGISTPPVTWQQLHDDAKKLTTGGDQWGYYIPQWDAPLPISYTWQAGGSIVDSSGKVTFDTPEFKTALQHYLSFYQDKLVPTASDFDQTTGFISGQTPMLVSGPYLAKAISDQAPDLNGKWSVTTVPTNVNGTSLYAGSTLGVWKTSKHADAALALINYLDDPTTQVSWYTANGDLPASTSALNTLQAKGDPLVAVYVKQLADSKLLPLVPAWNKISADMLKAVNDIALNGADLDKTLTTLNETVAKDQQ